MNVNVTKIAFNTNNNFKKQEIMKLYISQKYRLPLIMLVLFLQIQILQSML